EMLDTIVSVAPLRNPEATVQGVHRDPTCPGQLGRRVEKSRRAAPIAIEFDHIARRVVHAVVEAPVGRAVMKLRVRTRVRIGAARDGTTREIKSAARVPPGISHRPDIAGGNADADVKTVACWIRGLVHSLEKVESDNSA